MPKHIAKANQGNNNDRHIVAESTLDEDTDVIPGEKALCGFQFNRYARANPLTATKWPTLALFVSGYVSDGENKHELCPECAAQAAVRLRAVDELPEAYFSRFIDEVDDRGHTLGRYASRATDVPETNHPDDVYTAIRDSMIRQ